MTAQPFVVSISWRHAPLELREQFALTEADVASLLQQLAGTPSVAEAMVISTCNRVEVYGVTAPAVDGLAASAAAWEALLGASRIVTTSRAAAEAAVVRLHGEAAVGHLFRVVCSIESLVIGETQIMGQVRQATIVARRHQMIGARLDGLLQAALLLARRVRRETALGQGSASVASVAVQLAQRVFGELAGHRVLMRGAGKMSRLAARHLRAAGATSVTVANRSRARADSLAMQWGATAVPWEGLAAALVDADVVVSSTGATTPVLTRELMKRVGKQRRYRPLVIIDIAVPRDAAPAVSEIDGMYLFDIDDLERVVASTMQARQAAADVASLLVEAEVRRYLAQAPAPAKRTAQGKRPGPAPIGVVAAELTAHVNDIVQRELAVAQRRLAGRQPAKSDPVASAELQRALRRVAQKFLHQPLTALKFSGADERAQLTAAAQALFGLAGGDGDVSDESEAS
ncbi:MAG: glutamyl-tRNA reductase [Myxococcales bacterium]|nr:glutamyl-tRNA reductase [Myxococcales bacterium]